MSENTNPAMDAMNQSLHQKSFSNILLLIPTRNEEAAVGSLVVEARQSGFTNILVVDGFSTDATRKNAAAAGATVMEQEFGRGKGCGVRTGMKLFLQSSSDLLAIIDGDGTNIPSNLKEMIPLIEDARADVVLGSRTVRQERFPLHEPIVYCLQPNRVIPLRCEIQTTLHGRANWVLALLKRNGGETIPLNSFDRLRD